jgi:hypothetical protein
MAVYLSQAGGGGGGKNYDLNSIPMFLVWRATVNNPTLGVATSTTFYTGNAQERDLNSIESGFFATKGTGWATVYNHSGSGSLVWFVSTGTASTSGRVIVKLTVDGETRQLDVTADPARTTNTTAGIYVGSQVPFNSNGGSTNYSSSAYNSGSSSTTYRFNNDWHLHPTTLSPIFSSSGGVANYSVLKYETNLKIEVYNSNSNTSDANNYCGGMVIQNY